MLTPNVLCALPRLRPRTRSPEARRCERVGCGRSTCEGKPYCTEHVLLNPYAEELMARLSAQEAEQARVRRLGARGVDVRGTTAGELLHELDRFGPLTRRRLVQHLRLPEAVMQSYLEALLGAGLVGPGPRSRGLRRFAITTAGWVQLRDWLTGGERA